ncbi:SDR family oxidoreductase [soil metagenome]
MDLRLAGKSAIVSGGTAGIGLAIAERLLEEGASVMIVGRNVERAEAAVARLADHHTARVASHCADMTAVQGVADVVDAAQARFGRIDIAVSNVIGHQVEASADAPPPGHFCTVAPIEYVHEFEQLVMSAWRLASAVVPQMRQQGFGRIINIGSGVARESAWELPHILPNTVRPAAAGLYRMLARDLVGSGVTVNSLLTGSINTERNRAYYTWLAAERGETLEQIDAESSAHIPLRRRGKPEEMAAVAAFLCSEAAGGISGQSIAVTGGTTRHIF